MEDTKSKKTTESEWPVDSKPDVAETTLAKEKRQKKRKSKKRIEKGAYTPPEEKVIVLVGRQPDAKTKLQVRTSHQDATGLFEAIDCVLKGEVPSNGNLTYLLDHAKEKSEAGAKDGETKRVKEVRQNLERILEDTKVMLIEKNSGDRIQNIVRLAKLVSEEEAKASTVDPQKTLQEVTPFRKEAAELATALKNLALYLVTSKEFRRLLTELVDVTQSLLKYSAQSEKTGPLFAAVKGDIGENNKHAENTKDAAKSLKGTVQEDWKDGRILSETEKKQVEEQLKTMLRQVAKTKRFRTAMKDIFIIVEHSKLLKEKTKKDERVVEPTTHENLKELNREVKALILQFTGRSPDPILEEMRKLRRMIRKDEELRRLIADVREYCMKTLREPKELQDDIHVGEGRDLVDRIFKRAKEDSRKDSELRVCIGEITNELKWHLKGIKEDATFVHLADDVKSLGNNVFFTPTGEPSLRPLINLVKDIRTVYLPVLQTEVESLKFPRIEGSTEKYEFMVDGLTLKPIDIVPDSIHLSVTYDMEAHLKTLSSDHIDALVTFEVKDIKQELENVMFDFQKRNGKFHDKGTANIQLHAFSMMLQWRAQYDGENWKFSVTKTSATAKKLNIHVKSDYHQFLDSVALTFFGGMIRRRILGTVQEQLALKANELSALLEHRANMEKKKDDKEVDLPKTSASLEKPTLRKEALVSVDSGAETVAVSSA